VRQETCWWNLGGTIFKLEWLKSPATMKAASGCAVWCLLMAACISFIVSLAIRWRVHSNTCSGWEFSSKIKRSAFNHEKLHIRWSMSLGGNRVCAPSFVYINVQSSASGLSRVICSPVCTESLSILFTSDQTLAKKMMGEGSRYDVSFGLAHSTLCFPRFVYCPVAVCEHFRLAG